MSTYSDAQQREMDQASGAEMDRRAERAIPVISVASYFVGSHDNLQTRWQWVIRKNGKLTESGMGFNSHAEAMEQAIQVAQGRVA